MTVARRRGVTIDPIAAPVPSPPIRRIGPGLGAGVPLADAPAPDLVTPVGRLRRCTFRRIDRVTPVENRPQDAGYEVMCLYGGAEEPLSLGDLDEAKGACNACRKVGIFRPDEA